MATKLEFNTVDFVEGRQTLPCRFGPVHTAWRRSRPRQAVEFTLLPICCQNRKQSWTYTATVDSVADLLPVSVTARLSTKSTVLNSTLLPVCTGLHAHWSSQAVPRSREVASFGRQNAAMRCMRVTPENITNLAVTSSSRRRVRKT